jgi:hypothetical protein
VIRVIDETPGLWVGNLIVACFTRADKGADKGAEKDACRGSGADR